MLDTWVVIHRRSFPAEHSLRVPTTSVERITAVVSSTMFFESQSAFQNSLDSVRMWSHLKQKFLLIVGLFWRKDNQMVAKVRRMRVLNQCQVSHQNRGLTSKHHALVHRKAQCKIEWIFVKVRVMSNLLYAFYNAAKHLYTIYFLIEKSITC